TEARASLSVRLAPGQDAAAMSVLLEQTLRDACPAHAELELEMWPPGEPAWMDPSHPALLAGFDAIERATGVRPLAIRSGGSIRSWRACACRPAPTCRARRCGVRSRPGSTSACPTSSPPRPRTARARASA